MHRHHWKWGRKLSLMLVGLLFFLPSVVKGSSVEQEYYSDAYGWQEGFTLIVTDCVTIDDTHAAVNYIRSTGGQVAIVSPPRVMVGWIPVELSRELIGNQHIQAIHYDPLPEKEAASAFGQGPDLALVKFFNRVVSGEVRSEQIEAASITGTPLINDMREAPPVNWAQIEAMAASAKETPIKVPWGTGVKEVSSLAPSPAGAGNNDNMTGECAALLWFVESDGTGSDPNTYTWTAAHVTDTLNEFFVSMGWWIGQSNAHGSPITVWYGYYDSTDAVSQTQYEPILHSSAEDYKWYHELYDNVGLPASTNWWDRADAYNAYLRSVWKVTWAYHTFICYNPSPAPSTFTDGYFAYCYLGRIIQELYNNDGWGPGNFDKVHAHETGHIYWAGDEYYVAGYGGCAGCGYTYSGSNGTRNGNCVKGGCGPGYDCIMNNNQWTLCSYTPRQIGWDEIYPRSLVVTAHGNGGSSVVKVWNTQNNTVLFNQAVFGAGNTNGEVMVASGDVDGDGLPELICGHGTDGSSSVRVLELNGTELANWKAFGAANLNGQVHVAAGDVDGDGTDEVICGQGRGTSWIKVFEYDGTQIKSLKAFGAVNTEGEVNVASGDIDADGTDEIICGHGWLGKSWVKAFELDGTLIFNLKAFGAANPNGEVNLGSGNVDGDADDDIICGHHQGGSSWVKVFSLQGWLLFNKKAFGAANAAGSVYVAAGNLDGDVSDEIICAHGRIAYGGSWVKVFERNGSLIWTKKAFGAANSQGEVPVSGFGGANKGLTYGYTQYIPGDGYGDEYEFWANAGAVVTIFVDRLSSTHDPEFALVDIDRTTQLANVDDTVPCSIAGPSICPKVISYNILANGVYYINVEDSTGTGGPYWYKLYLTVESGFASNLTLLTDNYTPEWVSPPASKKKSAEK